MPKSVPSLQRPQEPRVDGYVDSREDMGAGPRTVRFDDEGEDLKGRYIGKVSDLFESVPSEAGTSAHERRPFRWDPGKSADGSTSIAEVESRAERHRNPCERRSLFNWDHLEIRELLHQVSHFRSDVALREPETQRKIQALTASDGDLDSKGRSIEVLPPQGQPITRMVQHRPIGMGNRVPGADAHLNRRLLEQKTLTITLSRDPGREKKPGGREQEKRPSNSTPVTDQDVSPLCRPASDTSRRCG